MANAWTERAPVRTPQSADGLPGRGNTPQSASGLGLKSPHFLTGLVCAALIGAGLVSRGELDLSPEDGLGYGLGIFGLAAMIGLLGYSLRKRLRWLRSAGPLRGWFEIHLMLGLLGPTAILYHSGFELGSVNSTVSMACMVAVAGSGVGGRFLYGRLHRSLAGERRTVGAFYKGALQEIESIASVLERVPGTAEPLREFVALATRDPMLVALPWTVLRTRIRARAMRGRMLRAIRRAAGSKAVPAPIQASLSRSLDLTVRAVDLRLFEKLFSLWHAIHLPLTLILFVSAFVHVVAVHLY
jgi:hypothetical protein